MLKPSIYSSIPTRGRVQALPNHHLNQGVAIQPLVSFLEREVKLAFAHQALKLVDSHQPNVNDPQQGPLRRTIDSFDSITRTREPAIGRTSFATSKLCVG